MSGPRSIGRLFQKRIEKSKNDQAIGIIEQGQVNFFSFEDYWLKVETLALALKSLDVEKARDKVGILGETCLEWHLMDMACLTSGPAVIPIYPTYLAEELAYIFNHSESTVLVLQNEEQFEKLLAVQDQLEKLRYVIYWNPISSDQKNRLKDGVQSYSFSELELKGVELKRNAPQTYKELIEDQKSEDVASIIYTSGTTGEPKGAVITQHAFCSMLKNVDQYGAQSFGNTDRTLTFLPLSHVFGRVDSLLPIIYGWEMVFAESIDKIVDNIGISKPTIMLAVPRIFEKIYAKIFEQVEAGSFLKKKIFKWATEVSNTYFNKLDDDEVPTTREGLEQKLAYKLVFSKIYQKFGGRLRFFVSGGAPLSPDVMKFLRNAKLTILEGYGLTETIAPVVINPFYRQVPGTVGVPMGDVEISFAEDGEILIKTEGLFSGYYKNPEATAEAIKDGLFHSGDIGEFNSKGFLKITDRKKDIIVTSGGKNVAPQKIENMMKTKRYISHFVVIGDQKNYLTAIVGIEKEKFINTLSQLDLEADCTHDDLVKNPGTRELIQKDIDEVNQKLARYETIKKFILCPIEFTQDNYLTPSLKVKKKVLIKDYFAEINALYAE